MVGGQGVWAFIWPMVGGQASLVGRLTTGPLRQRGSQDWLPLGNRNWLSKCLSNERPLKTSGRDVVLDPPQLHQLLLLLVRKLLTDVVHARRPEVWIQICFNILIASTGALYAMV